MTKLTDLSQPELDVLLLLVQARVTASAVTLAADLWRTTTTWMAEDPYPLMTYILDSLSSRGLVRFRLPASGAESVHAMDFPFDIRLTPKGWELLGYSHKTTEVGSLGRHEREPRLGDNTDYLNHKYRSEGGPIEVEDFPTHRAHFPSHIHMYGEPLVMANQALTRNAKRTARLADPTVLQDPNGMGERGYIRITARDGSPRPRHA